MSNNKDTPILTKGNTLDFGTSTAMPPASEDDSTSKRKSSKPTKTDVFIKTIEENNKQNKDIADSLNKLGDFLKSNSQQLDKVAENLDSNTKAIKKQADDNEDEKKRNKSSKSKKNDKDSSIEDLTGEALIKRISGDPAYKNVDKTTTSLAAGINPLLGVVAEGLESMGINSKNIGKSIKDTITGDYKKDKKGKDSDNKIVKEIEDNSPISADPGISSEPSKSGKRRTSKRAKAIDDPIVSQDPIIPEKTDSAKAKEKDEAEKEVKRARELDESRHKETIKELKSIDKSVKEIDMSKGGLLETLTTILGAGGAALLGGLIFSKQFREMVVGNIKEWFNSPLGSIKNAWAEFIFKLESKMIDFSGKFVKKMAGMVTGAIKGMSATGGKLGAVVKDIVVGVTSKVKSAMSMITNSVKGVMSLMKNSVKSVFGVIQKSFDKLGVIGSAVGKSISWAGKGVSWIGKGLSIVSKVFKGILKCMPFVGTIMSLVSAYRRFKQGDYKGAMLDVASAVAAAFPGAGTVVSMGIDAVNLGRDLTGSSEEEAKKNKGGDVRELPATDAIAQAIESEVHPVEPFQTPIPGASTNSRNKNYTPVSFGKDANGNVTPFKSSNQSVNDILCTIKDKSKDYGYDANRVAGRIKVESNFNPKAYNRNSGAMGLGQFIPSAWRDYGRGGDPFDPEDNIDATIRYMMNLDKKYKGDTRKADAAYNWGPGFVDRAVATYGDNWIEGARSGGINWKGRQRYMPQETYDYMSKNASATKSFAISDSFNDIPVKSDEPRTAELKTSDISPTEPLISKDAIKVADSKTPVIPVTNSDNFTTYTPTKKTIAQATSPGILDTSSNPKTANNIMNERIQTDLANNINMNQTQIASASTRQGGGNSVTINSSNFIPVNTSAYIGLHQA